MITMQSISRGQAEKYDYESYEADDYYTEHGLMPAHWGGKLAAELGLSGDFDHQKFSRALQGDFDRFEFKQKPSPKRAALDICFSAPKSWSIMALVAGDKRLIAAHDEAVAYAMSILEKHARVRVTADGKTESVPVDGIAYAGFRHDTSRLGDCNLHTHNTVFKSVMGPDGELLSLDNQEMFRAQRMADMAYKQFMAMKGREFGFSLVMTKDGFELEGVSSKLIEEMSGRKAQIDARLDELGLSRDSASAAARQAANLDTRNAKKTYDREALVRWWNDRVNHVAQALGVSPDSLFARQHQASLTTKKELEHGNQSRSREEHHRHSEPPREPPPFRRNRMHHVSELDVVHDARAEMLLSSDVSHDVDSVETDDHRALRRDGDRSDAGRGGQPERSSPGSGAGASGARAGSQPAEGRGGISGELRFTAEGALALALEHAMERESILGNVHHLMADAIQFSEFRVNAEEIDKAIQASIARGDLIAVGNRLTTREAVQAEAVVYAAYDAGRGVVEAMAEAKATAEGIALMEKRLGEGLVKRAEEKAQQNGDPPLTQEQKEAWRAKARLSEGQRIMVERITLGTNRIMVVEGDAGTGKSTGMEAVKNIAEAKGFKVLGLAPSKQAVESLQAAGIDTVTSQGAKDNERFWDKVNSKTLLVLDEAGLVDVRTMRTLLERAAEKGARIAVVGDDKQFASVEAGRALYQLNEKAKQYGEEIRLDEMRRWQKSKSTDEFMRAMHFDARDNPVEALDKLLASGNAVVHQNDGKRIAALAKEYTALDEKERISSLVLTGTNADRVAINTAIREALGREGGMEVDTFERFDITKAQTRQLAFYEEGYVVRFETKADGFAKGEMCRVVEKTSDKVVLERADGTRVDFHPHRQATSISIGNEERIEIANGERIRVTANDSTKDKRFANGDRGTVVAVEKDKLHIRLDKGKDVVVPLDGKTPLSLRYGYCQTGHSAQGATATTVLLHIKSTDATADRKSWYTNITRAACTIRLFTDALEGKRLGALRQAIAFTKNKELAHEAIKAVAKPKMEQRLTYIGQGKGIGREDLAADSTKEQIADVLTRAMDRFTGEKLHIEGGRKFQERVAQVVAEKGIDVKFTDRALNDRIKAILEKIETRAAAKAERTTQAPQAPAQAASDKGGVGQGGSSSGSKLDRLMAERQAKIEQQKQQEQEQQKQQQQKHHRHSHDF